ncbi:MFS transporter, DHA1 family, purine ribonucleoside efflux pump [Microlunatus sagamiharensis]|uniref:MFS transporter, DHA1 family, purine ribonucleoside efflux pump n=1 Tax=Microlunatus sagamiharensis TaxID=546874 RepID=A0A1H2MLB6_9ACTN|nr:MFS transporter [Microlunatus sagamiharensis]SDU93979.1 MFS transporter, DHA1 family, purine ribonucleoside efflux pump [Microlunatus sagamiharensis]
MTSTVPVSVAPVTAPPAAPDAPARTRSGWPGVIALMVAVFTLVTSEFLPASLLPLMAADLGVTEGVAGQVVTATALVGMVAGPSMGLLFPRLDRRRLIIGLLALAVVSNLLSAIAPTYAIVVVSRLLLGVALAGTWAMALAVASTLVPADKVGRAMAVVNLGVSAATVAAVPLGALISSLYGWRAVFWAVAIATAAAVVLFVVAMPSVPAAASEGVRTLLAVLRRRVMILGLIGLAVMIAGHFGSYTFIRTAAEGMPEMTPALIAILLAVYGLGGLFGNVIAGLLADHHLGVVLVAVPSLLAVSILGFSLSDGSVVLAFAAIAVWGLGFGAIPTTSQTWASRAEPTRVEAAGGLFVANFQLAIALGAALGGVLLDGFGVHTVFLVGAVAVLAGGALFASTRRLLPR